MQTQTYTHDHVVLTVGLVGCGDPQGVLLLWSCCPQCSGGCQHVLFPSGVQSCQF